MYPSNRVRTANPVSVSASLSSVAVPVSDGDVKKKLV